MCQKFVKKHLKSPKSADFSETSSTGKHPDYVVKGAVDSDNSFGAAIRNNYECDMHYSGNDSWELKSLTGLDE